MDLPISLDRIDYTILHHVQANAKITNAQLAQHIGLAPASTLERVRKLEMAHIIQGYHAELAPEKLALHTRLIIQITLHRLTPDQIAVFKTAVATLTDIVTCYHVIGHADFLLEVVTTDIQAYQHRVVEKLSTLDVIKNLNTFVIVATLKKTGIALPT